MLRVKDNSTSAAIGRSCAVMIFSTISETIKAAKAVLTSYRKLSSSSRPLNRFIRHRGKTQHVRIKRLSASALAGSEMVAHPLVGSPLVPFIRSRRLIVPSFVSSLSGIMLRLVDYNVCQTSTFELVSLSWLYRNFITLLYRSVVYR